ACLLHVEIDRLRTLTDRLGAEAGQAVVDTVSSILVERMPSQLVARGDTGTFFVLLHEVALSEASERAQAICRAVRTVVLNWRGETLYLSVSVGIVDLSSATFSGADALCA